MGKIGLVLSGGGAKGAYEAGVVKALIDARIKFDVIAGTSVGGLNAALIASNQINDLIKVWEEKTTNDSVFVLNPKLKLKFTFGDILLLLPIVSLFWMKKKVVKVLSRVNSIGDSSPLRNLVKGVLNIDSLKSSGNRLILTGTNLQIGDEETFVKTEDGKFFIKRKDWVKEIKDKDFEKMAISTTMATSAIPVAFNPEVISGYQYVDGGVGNNTPLMNAIKSNCKDIFTVLVKPPYRTPLDTQFDSLLSIGARTLEIFLENTTEEDFQRAKLINDVILNYQKMSDGIDIILKNVKDKEITHQIQTVIDQSFPFKHIDGDKGLINNIVIQPAKDIDLGLLEFDPEKLKKAVRQGYQDGCKKLEELAETERLEELDGKRLECVECEYETGCEGKKVDKKFYDTIDRFIGKTASSGEST
ncbi:MAG: patatin-like phospholipase family protein [bacterium]